MTKKHLGALSAVVGSLLLAAGLICMPGISFADPPEDAFVDCALVGNVTCDDGTCTGFPLTFCIPPDSARCSVNPEVCTSCTCRQPVTGGTCRCLREMTP